MAISSCTMANGCLRDPKIWEYFQQLNFWVFGIFIVINGRFVEEQAFRITEYHRRRRTTSTAEARATTEASQSPRPNDDATNENEKDAASESDKDRATTENANDTTSDNNDDDKSAPSSPPSATAQLLRPLPTWQTPTEYHFFWLQPLITTSPRQFLAILVSGLILALHFLEASWVLKTCWRLTSTMFVIALSDSGVLIADVIVFVFVCFIAFLEFMLVVLPGFVKVMGQCLLVLQLFLTNINDPLG